jgi:hypothetical protein
MTAAPLRDSKSKEKRQCAHTGDIAILRAIEQWLGLKNG